MAHHNLTFKNIREFTPDDTIFIRKSLRGFDSTNVYRFVKFEKNRVTGVTVDGKGEELSAEITRCALYGKLPNENRERYHWFDPIGHAAYESAEKRHMAVPENHPSYGVVSISRQTSSHNESLFGSSILHNQLVSLKISRAELQRDLHRDRIHGGGTPLIEILMSPQQFADMLTSPNTGGTPVTLRYLEGEPVEACPFISKVEQFDMELESKIRTTHAETKQKLAQLLAMIEQSKMPKKDKEHIEKMVEGINCDVERNMPFLQSQLAEEMNKVVGEAKTAITSYLQQESLARGLPAPTTTPISLG